jgi:hypothetical protein
MGAPVVPGRLLVVEVELVGPVPGANGPLQAARRSTAITNVSALGRMSVRLRPAIRFEGHGEQGVTR